MHVGSAEMYPSQTLVRPLFAASNARLSILTTRAGNEEIATLQTEYFSKPCQKPVFSHLENTEKNFEEGPSRGALLQRAVPSA